MLRQMVIIGLKNTKYESEFAYKRSFKNMYYEIIT